MKNILRSIFRYFNLGIVKYPTIQLMHENINAKRDLDFLKAIPVENTSQILELLNRSKSQLNQDLFVLSQLNFKENGYFVEFGAADGLLASNTYLLEKEFGWAGILAEPAKCWHNKLKENRKADLEFSCVWKNTGSMLNFNEVAIPELSTLLEFSSNDGHGATRKKGETYQVSTISLINLLQKYNAPKVIDYLSLDTEGSEYDILENFDFSSYEFRIITCEHNYTPMRTKINALLVSKGYKRILSSISQFDDWYIKESLIP